MDREVVLFIFVLRKVLNIIRFTGSLSHHYIRLNCRQFKRLPKECPTFKYKRHYHWLNVVL